MLPQVYLTVDSLDKVTKDVSSHAVIAIFENNNAVSTQPEFSSECMVHYRGATASLHPKKSFSVALIDSVGNSSDRNILGIREDDKWILDAMAIDKSRMRNRVCFDIWNEVSSLRSNNMLRNGTVGKFVEVYLNGQYNGLYCLSDKVNRKLLGVKKNKSGGVKGVLYKCSRGDTPNHWLRATDIEEEGTKWGDWDLEYPDEYPCEATWQPLKTLVTFTDKIDTDSAFVAAHLGDYFHIDNLIDYCLFLQVFALVDNAMHNSFMSCENIQEDTRMWITPWDLDGSFGRDGVSNLLNRPGAPWLVFQNASPFRNFFDDNEEALVAEVGKRWNELKDSIYSVEHISDTINHYRDLFIQTNAWTREREKWDGTPVELTENINEELKYMKEWYAMNHQYLCTLFEAYSTDISQIITTNQKQTDDTIFMIDGRRSLVIPKGVYIRDGKKYIGKSK